MRHLHYIATNPTPQKQHKEGSPYLSDCSRLILLAQLAVHYKTTQQENLLNESLEELKRITTDGHAKKAAKKNYTKSFKSFFRIVYKTVKIKKFDKLRWHLFSLIESMQKLGIDTTRFIPEEYAKGLSRSSSRDDYITLADNCYKDFKFIFEYEADTLALEEMFKKINQYEAITHITQIQKTKRRKHTRSSMLCAKLLFQKKRKRM